VSRRGLLHPLPAGLAALFIAVAAVDLVYSLRKEPLPPPRMLVEGAVRFAAFEPVVSLAPGTGVAGVELAPQPLIAGRAWSPPVPAGRWVMASGAALELELARGGHRSLVLEGRTAAAGPQPRRLRVLVNGVDCGVVELERSWRRRVVALPGGATRPGRATVAFEVLDRDDAGRRRRTVLLRRLGLFFDPSPTPAALDGDPPLGIDFAAESVTLRAPGHLVVPFTMEERVDALTLAYEFDSPAGEAVLEVARPEGGGPGRDAPIRRELRAAEGRSGSVRFVLHGRRGLFHFTARVAPGPRPARLELRSIRLVSEEGTAGL
jgi:hypothetical protein